MGGLVFKQVGNLFETFPISYIQLILHSAQAYLQALNNPEYRHLALQFRAVLFLSTPHRGADLAETLNRILTVSVFGHSPKKYIADLYKNSHVIEDINENFRHHASKLLIFSFYETLQTSVGPKSVVCMHTSDPQADG